MAGITVRYEPPSEAEWTRLHNKPQIGAALHRIGGQAMALAQAISPVETGEYLSSFSVEASLAFIDGKPRQAADLVNDADHALLVELRHHVLTRTASSLGALK